MTDEQTPEPQKIPPKLTVRTTDSKGESEKNADNSAKKNGVAPVKPVVPDTGAGDKPETPAITGDEPTVVLKKSPADMENKKKTTSRIPLDSALSMRISDAMGEVNSDSADRGPKTIRLSRPPSAGQPPKPSADVAADVGSPKTIRLKRPAGMTSPESKSKTSRIPLDKVLQDGDKNGESLAAGGATDIKTIRLQRPNTGKSQPVAGQLSEEASAADTDAGKAAAQQESKSRTSRLDTPETGEPAADAIPSTQRKTIRIKRPDGTGAAKASRTLSLARDKSTEPSAESTEETESGLADGTIEKPAPSQGPGLFFTITAVAAVIIAAMLVYMLAVQAFPDAGLSWWGQINI